MYCRAVYRVVVRWSPRRPLEAAVNIRLQLGKQRKLCSLPDKTGSHSNQSMSICSYFSLLRWLQDNLAKHTHAHTHGIGCLDIVTKKAKTEKSVSSCREWPYSSHDCVVGVIYAASRLKGKIQMNTLQRTRLNTGILWRILTLIKSSLNLTYVEWRSS